MPKLRFDQYVSCAAIVLGLVLGTSQWQPTKAAPQTYQVKLLSDAPVPILAREASQIPPLATEAARFTATLSAQAVYVTDLPSGSVLLAKNESQTYYPASTTKLMTALVALDVYELNQVLPFTTTFPSEGSTIGFNVGEQLAVQDILAAMLINSANDAAMSLANNYPLGYYGFINAMNDKATQLHMDQTHFSNPAGLDTTEHYASARDLSLLSREVLKQPFLTDLVDTQVTTITDVTGTHSHTLVNTNALLGQEEGVVGVKTGTTPLAGQVLITKVDKQGHQILIVMLGSQNRYGETKAIINWVFSHYHWLGLNSDKLE